MTKLKTTFANGVNPFAQLNSLVAPKEAPIEKTSSQLSAEMCIIDELPPPRITHACKYDVWFSKLKPGQAIKCKNEDVHVFADGLRRRAKASKEKWKLATIKKHPSDGMGRVYRVA